jgi:hypothetical protein
VIDDRSTTPRPRLHLYGRAPLEDPAERYLIPLCQENEMYPARHPRDMVAINEDGKRK